MYLRNAPCIARSMTTIFVARSNSASWQKSVPIKRKTRLPSPKGWEESIAPLIVASYYRCGMCFAGSA